MTQSKPDPPKQTLLFIKAKPSEELVEKPVEKLVDRPVEKPVTRLIKSPEKPKKLVKREQPEPKSEELLQPRSEPASATEKQQHSNSMFQAVGIIVGTVRFEDNGKSFVNMGGKEYALYYIPNRKRKAFDALVKEIEATGNYNQRLIVYPRVLHFPRKEQPYNLSFQLVGFDNGQEQDGVAKELQDFEFRLCGLWQFIPVCQVPCITVLRNFDQQRLEYINREETSVISKAKFLKASHVPLIWRDAPARPFRFNPKASKEQQGHAMFVEVLAKFLPERNVFNFNSLLAPPQEKPPRFLKARKEDKVEAIKAIKALKSKKQQ